MPRISLIFLLLIISLLFLGCTTNSHSTISATSSTLPTSPESQTEILKDALPAEIVTSPSTSLGVRAASAIQPYRPGLIPPITTIQMFSHTDGWAVSGAESEDEHLLRTEDGGNTWIDWTPPETSGTRQAPKRVLTFFYNPKEAWAIYRSNVQPADVQDSLRVWSTNDGGVHWLLSDPLDPASIVMGLNEPRFLEFINSQVGWLAVSHDPGAGQAPMSIYQTTNAGKNWRLIRTAFDQPAGHLDTCCQSGMSFLDERTGLFTNLYGPISSPFIDITQDGGKTWQTVELPLPEQRFADVGYCGTQSPLSLPSQTIYLVVQCLDPDSQTGTSLAFLYSTSDNGKTWRIKPLPDPYFDEDSWTINLRSFQIHFLDTLNGWVIITDHYQAGDAAPTQTAAYFFQTGDGGEYWEMQANPSWSGSVSFIDLDHGWAAASDRANKNYALTVTDSGGRFWRDLNPEVALP